MSIRNNQSFLSFSLIWFGQVISLTGSGLTSFGLGIWIYQQTGQATSFAMTLFFAILPVLLLSPLAGILVDRSDYRMVMILSDTCAALSSLAIALLLSQGALQLWHIYLAAAINSACGVFQHPAYTALTSQLVTTAQLGRTNGLLQAGFAAADILSPMIAGALMLTIGLNHIILIDFITFAVAIITLMAVRLPVRSGLTRLAPVSLHSPAAMLREIAPGWLFIVTRPGLIGLLIFFALSNFASGIIGALLIPMLMTFTTANVIGTIITIAGSGMLAGSLFLSAWGGPAKRIKAVIGFELLKGLAIMGIGWQQQVWLVAASAAIAHFTIPLVNGLNQAIWQAKVPQAIQGRVFALRSMLAKCMLPVAFLIAGPLADRVLEPLMLRPPDLLAVFGNGPGRGMGVVFFMMGSLIILTAVTALLIPPIQTVEGDTC
jgi:MFS family permease